MPDIKTVLQNMIDIGEKPEKIQEVANKYKEANPGWSVTATTEDDPEIVEEKTAIPEVKELTPEVDTTVVYEYQTPDKTKFPDAVPAWGKSTDAGETFEVVAAEEVPKEWFEDPNFKEAWGEINKKAIKTTALGGIWNTDYPGLFGGLSYKVAASAAAITESLKDPEERKQIKQFLERQKS